MTEAFGDCLPRSESTDCIRSEHDAAHEEIQPAPAEGGIGVPQPRPQAPEFDRGLPMTVLDFMAMLVSNRPAFRGPTLASRDAILAALAEVGMDGKAGRRMGALSGGERQRVLLAQGLSNSRR